MMEPLPSCSPVPPGPIQAGAGGWPLSRDRQGAWSALLLHFAWLLPLACRSATYEAEVAPRAGESFSKAAFRLWLADGPRPPRALLILAPGYNADGRAWAEDPAWQRWAAKRRLAIVAVCFQSSVPPGGGPAEANSPRYHRADLGSARALQEAITSLAQLSGVPALRHLPLLMWGHSAGGQFNYGFACVQPDRVIAFAAIKGGYYHTPMNPASRQVPAVFVVGENDLGYRVSNPRQLVTTQRKESALWCLAIEPGAGHAVGEANALVFPFFDAVLDRRLRSAGALAKLDERSGWLGDLATGVVAAGPCESASSAETIWLPDEISARQWAAWHEPVSSRREK